MKTKLSLVGLAAVTTMLLCACGGGNHFSVSKLKGTYTIYADGWDSSFYPISVIGSIVLDGKGNVTSGEQDSFNSNTGNEYPVDAITGGTISIGNDGRGTLTISPTSAPAETFSFVQVNTKHLLVTEFDNNATSAGSMDLQTVPASLPSGGDAFVLRDSYHAGAVGGVITAQGTAITTGEGDDDYVGNPEYAAYQGSMTAPDLSGRGTITLASSTLGTLNFAYYVVGPEVFRLIETDNGQYLAGSMYGQGTAAGAFSAASLGGNFVFGQQGENDVGFSGLYGAAGQFTADGSGTFTAGVADVNEGDGTPVLAGDISASGYDVASDGYGYIQLPGTTTDVLTYFGLYMVDPAINIADPNSTTGGGGALMTDLDYDSLGTGFAVPQATAASFSGNYAFSQDGAYETGTAGGSFDLIGRLNSNGSSKLTGTVDFNDISNTGQNPDVNVTGTYADDGTNPGRATAQITVTGAAMSPENVTAYQASDDLLLHVDTDSPASNEGNTGFGVLEKQQ
jgi:hypothetical protein